MKPTKRELEFAAKFKSLREEYRDVSLDYSACKMCLIRYTEQDLGSYLEYSIVLDDTEEY